MIVDLARRRMTSQHLIDPAFTDPADVVRHLVAVQAQDFSGAKWALALRSTGVSDDIVERAFADGRILRTHLLRPTWHFVSPSDIRWLLALTAPRVKALNASIHKRIGLDATVFTRSNRAIAQALQRSQSLTRDDLRDALKNAGVNPDGDLRLGYLLMQAELEGIICSGPRRGRQFTYALLDHRVPGGRTLAPDEALAELTYRYFVSRGPATVHDMAKWSGLTVTAVRKGLDEVRHNLVREVIGEQTYWRAPSTSSARVRARATPAVHLLSIYDEYVSAYKDRRAMADEETRARLSSLGNALTHLVVVDGKAVGHWKPAIERRTAGVSVERFRELTSTEERALSAAVVRYRQFVGRTADAAGPTRVGGE